MTKKSLFYKLILNLEAEIVRDMDGLGFLEAIKKGLGTCDFTSFDGMHTMRECLPLTKDVGQYYSPMGFGKFNLTLVNNGHFFIMAMYMDDISTEIHDHPFEGVFTPLAGSPFQLGFNFHHESSLSDFIDKGKLSSVRFAAISPGESVEIRKETIHMLSRPNKGQFSLLICRLLPHDHRQNHFFLYPGLRIKNRTNSNYLARVISSFQEEAHLTPLLESLAPDELIQLHFRTHSQLSQTALDSKLILKIKQSTGEILKASNLWDSIMSHQDFMLNTKQKIQLLRL
jgi:hypothetical protein